jgi:hypothetical protein
MLSLRTCKQDVHQHLSGIDPCDEFHFKLLTCHKPQVGGPPHSSWCIKGTSLQTNDTGKHYGISKITSTTLRLSILHKGLQKSC